MKHVKKGWGSEKWIENNERYCLKELMVEYQKRCSTHFHVNKKETFYVLKGVLQLYVVDPKTGKEELIVLNAGESYTLEPCTPHWFTTLTFKSVFIEASSHHDDEDSYRTVPGDSQKEETDEN